MRDRVKSLQRVLAVQQQVVRLAEWRLATLERQGAELKADQARLHEFVSGGDPLSPPLSAAAFVRGKSLQGAVARNEAAAAAQTIHTDVMRRREALAERLVGKAVVQADQAAEKRDLEETIEAFSRRQDASLP